MPSVDDFSLTMEWFTAIAVTVVAFLLDWHGLWILSLCFTLVGQVLFLVLLVHTLDMTRSAKRSADARVPPAEMLEAPPTISRRHEMPRLTSDSSGTHTRNH